MFVSRESPDNTEARLRLVLAQADLHIFEGRYAFKEWPLSEVPKIFAAPGALAFVRDEDTWSALVPSEGTGEQFGLFSFHFKPGLDNSGFVGWLASRLKERCGTGVFVVCGHNSARGGVFDYWGYPIAVRDEVLAVLRELAPLTPPGL